MVLRTAGDHATVWIRHEADPAPVRADITPQQIRLVTPVAGAPWQAQLAHDASGLQHTLVQHGLTQHAEIQAGVGDHRPPADSPPRRPASRSGSSAPPDATDDLTWAPIDDAPQVHWVSAD